jgi:hypothetical protein
MQVDVSRLHEALEYLDERYLTHKNSALIFMFSHWTFDCLGPKEITFEEFCKVIREATNR